MSERVHRRGGQPNNQNARKSACPESAEGASIAATFWPGALTNIRTSSLPLRLRPRPLFVQTLIDPEAHQGGGPHLQGASQLPQLGQGIYIY